MQRDFVAVSGEQHSIVGTRYPISDVICDIIHPRYRFITLIRNKHGSSLKSPIHTSLKNCCICKQLLEIHNITPLQNTMAGSFQYQCKDAIWLTKHFKHQTCVVNDAKAIASNTKRRGELVYSGPIQYVAINPKPCGF